MTSVSRATSSSIRSSGTCRDARDTVKAHISQINSLLEETDWVIFSDRRRWYLQRR